MTSLCLLDGYEEVVEEFGVVRYVRIGERRDVASKFMLHLGNTVRLFRGHTLQSIYAPQYGVRYEGL